MQDKSFKEKINSKHLNKLSEFKTVYETEMKRGFDYNVFRIEENLYLYINKHFPELWNSKIELIKKFREKKNLWNIAFKNKYMNSDEISKYKKISEQKYFKTFYAEKLGAYFSLQIFAECNFNRELILQKPIPDKFAFTLFRMAYKGANPDKYNNWQFNEIIEDIEELLDKKRKNNIEKKYLHYTKNKEFLLESNLFLKNSYSLKAFLYDICKDRPLDGIKYQTISANVSRINKEAKLLIGAKLIKKVRKGDFWLEDYIVFKDCINQK